MRLSRHHKVSQASASWRGSRKRIQTGCGWVKGCLRQITEWLRLEDNAELCLIKHPYSKQSPPLGFSELCLVRFSISPRIDILQPIWTTCSSRLFSLINLTLPKKGFYLHLKDISGISVCACCLLLYHWTSPRRNWLHLLYFFPSGI